MLEFYQKNYQKSSVKAVRAKIQITKDLKERMQKEVPSISNVYNQFTQCRGITYERI